MNIHCGPNYPDVPPTVQFVSRVNLPCVDQRTGKVDSSYYENIHVLKGLKVDPSKLPVMVNWKRDNTMENILTELRRYMGKP